MADGERFGRLEVRMDRVEQGVSNFRDFQQDARDFFAEHRATEVEREKQLNKRDQEIKDDLARYHEVQGKRQFWLMWVISVLGVMIALLAYLEGHRAVKYGELTWPTKASSSEVIRASNQQQAGGFDPMDAQQIEASGGKP